jgi:hypothetical protein
MKHKSQSLMSDLGAELVEVELSFTSVIAYSIG